MGLFHQFIHQIKWIARGCYTVECRRNWVCCELGDGMDIRAGQWGKILIATSRYYDALHVLHFLVPLGILNFALIVFGTYLIIRSIIRMRHYDRLIHEIKLKHSIIGEFIDWIHETNRTIQIYMIQKSVNQFCDAKISDISKVYVLNLDFIWLQLERKSGHVISCVPKIYLVPTLWYLMVSTQTWPVPMGWIFQHTS